VENGLNNDTMKTQRLNALLALLLMVGGATMQAQEPLTNEDATGLFESRKAQYGNPIQQPSIVSEASEWLHYDDGIYNTNPVIFRKTSHFLGRWRFRLHCFNPTKATP
jgi:hypothetical protein